MFVLKLCLHKKACVITILIMLKFFFFACVSNAQEHNDYYSWYQWPRNNFYCTDIPCESLNLSEYDTCKIEDAATPQKLCPNQFLVVQNQVKGYRQVNNINDPKVTAHQDGGNLYSEPRWTLPDYYFHGGISNELTKRFRFFIPPGTTLVNFVLNLPREDYVALAVRWRNLPDESQIITGVYHKPTTNPQDDPLYYQKLADYNSPGNYLTFPFDRQGRYPISDLEERTYYIENKGGTIVVYSGGTGGALQKGGWLYIYTAFSSSGTFPGAESAFFSMQYTIAVETDTFRYFYNNAQWDGHGDPIPAGNIPTQYHLTVTPSGTGAGNITSDIGGIACSEAGADGCSKPFDSGRSVTLSAQADSDSGSTFAGWGGACSGTNLTCTLRMDGNKNVTARFNRSDQPEYSIEVTKAGNARGTVTSTPPGINCGVDRTTCYAEFSQNAEVVLTASAETGSVFDGWTGCSGSGNQCTVTVNGAKTVTATFNTQTTRQFTVTALMTTSGGSVAPSSVDVYSGSTAAFNVTPADDYLLDEPVEDACGNSGTLEGDTYTTGPITANCTVTFKFKPREIRHTVTAWAGSGGKIARSATETINPLVLTVNDQQSATINVKPDAGFRTSSQVSGSCHGTFNGDVYTISTVTAPCTAVFSFSPIEYSVSARLNDPNAGSIDVYTRTVARGQPASFTIGPYMDYAIDSVRSTGGCGTGAWFDNTYTTTPTGDDCVLTFNLLPATWYDLYRNWMIVPCLHYRDITTIPHTDTYWRLLMKTPTGTPGTPPYLIFDGIYPIGDEHGFTPQDCASLDDTLTTLRIPCYAELYNPQCREMEFTRDADSLNFQLQERPDGN